MLAIDTSDSWATPCLELAIAIFLTTVIFLSFFTTGKSCRLGEIYAEDAQRGFLKVRTTDPLLLLDALTLRGPSGGHCVELHLFFPPSILLFALTLRGPSESHCVELRFFLSSSILLP